MTNEERNGFVKEIEKQVGLLRSINIRIKELEDEISQSKAVKREYEEQVIPDIMLENGVTSVRLASGDSVEVKPFYYARIPKDNPDAFFAWLDANGHGALVKSHLEIYTTDGEIVELMKEFCEEFRIPLEVGRGIHWKTLEAWFREQTQKGANLPTNLFENYVGKKATIR